MRVEAKADAVWVRLPWRRRDPEPEKKAVIILELAECHGQPVKIAEIEETELRTADEVWMTSSTKEVLAITTLDGQPVGTGKPGPLAGQMWQWYQDFKNTVMRKG